MALARRLTVERVLADAAATGRAGEALGQVAAPGDVIALVGDLGAGKTTLVQGLARGLGVTSAWVSSPTFTIINEHPGRLALVHVDLYRLESARELGEIGIGEVLGRDDAVVAVEWWTRLAECGVRAPDHLEVVLEELAEGGRKLTLRPVGVRPAALAAAWLAMI